ncbi:MAG: phosphoserine phosphatase, partial [Euryarchaeota archaeon TMED255]
MSLAIFDLDNTLIADDSDHLWGMFLCEEGVVDANEYSKQNDEFFSNYRDGSLDIYAYQKFVLRPLAAMPLAKLEELRFHFISKKIDQI